MSTLCQDSIVAVYENCISSELPDNEAIILDLDAGLYYGLGAVGGRIWQLVQQPITVQEIYNTILAEYEVAPDRCETDLFGFLEQLIDHKLIQVENAADA